MSTDRRPTESAARIVDDLIGEPLSWVTGKEDVTRDRKPLARTDHALGVLLTWIGLGSRRASR
jgi:hypothetical protein